MKKIGLLAILFVGLLGFVYYSEFVLPKEDASRVAVEDSLLRLSDAPVEQMEIQTAKDSLVLQRAGPGWLLLSPVDALADGAKAEELVASLRNARRDRLLEVTGAQLAEYGLESPAVVLSIQTAGQTRKIRIGGLTYNGAQVYVQVDEEPQVILTTERLLENVRGGLFSWRDKELLDFDQRAVTRIRVSGSDSIVIEREGGAWQLVQPLRETADEGAVSGLLSAINFARIARFLDDAPDSLARFGLEPPQIEVELTQGEQKYRIAIGKTDGLDFAALSNQRNAVFAVRTSLVDKLSQSALSYRDRRVVRLEELDMSRLSYRNAALELALERSGSDWIIQSPQSHRGIPAIKGVFLLPVLALRYEQLETKPSSGLLSAFESPRFVLDYKLTAGGQSRFEFVEWDGKYWARQVGEPRLGEISAVDWGRLAWDVDRLTSTK